MVIDPQKKSKVAAKLYENLKKSGVGVGNLELIERVTKKLLDMICGNLYHPPLPISPRWTV